MMIEASASPTTDAAPSTAAPPTPAVLRVSDPRDVMSMVHHTIGYTPQRSLVLVTMYGRRMGAHLRLDLRPAEDDPARVAMIAGRALAGAHRSAPFTAVLALLYLEEEPVAPRHGDPSLRPYAALCEGLRIVLTEGLGVELREIWQVGGGYVREYDCEDLACCPYPGLPLEESRNGAVQRHIQARGGSAAGTVEEIVEDLLLPPQALQGHLVRSIREELRRIREAAPSSREDDERERGADQRVPADGDLLTLWETAAETTPGCVDLASLEQWLQENADVLPVLLDSVGDPGFRDAVLVLGAADLQTAQADTSRVDASLLDHPVYDLSPQDAAAAQAARFLRTLVGETGAAPQWTQLLRLEELLRVLWAIGDEQAAPDILAMLAWIEWAKGRGAVSGALLDRAGQRAPGHRLSHLLTAFVGAGAVCPWAQRFEHSWSFHEDRAAGVEDPPHPAWNRTR